MKKIALSRMGRQTAEPPISWLMHSALSRPRLMSLAAGFTDNPSLPVTEARTLLNDILSSPRTGQAALQYGTTAGDAELRRLTAEHVNRCDDAAHLDRTYSPDRVIITSGSQQLLYTLTEALCDRDDIVLVEDPTYFVYLGILESHGIQPRGVRMERDGLDLDHLDQILKTLKRNGELKRLKFLYLVSYFQNPTGATTSFAKKQGSLRLLKEFERAAGHPLYLLEDAAYRELRFAGKDVKSALAVRGFRDRAIYTGTFSKPFATGARVGFGILPRALLRPVLGIKANHDFGTSNLLQQLLCRALATGVYHRHVARLRKRYAYKARAMKVALGKHFPAGVEWWEAEGGLYYWARLPKQLRSGVRSKLFKSALANDVLYVPGELCYADDRTRRKPDYEMRLSFGSASVKDIQAGIARLGAVLKKMSA